MEYEGLLLRRLLTPLIPQFSHKLIPQYNIYYNYNLSIKIITNFVHISQFNYTFYHQLNSNNIMHINLNISKINTETVTLNISLIIINDFIDIDSKIEITDTSEYYCKALLKGSNFLLKTLSENPNTPSKFLIKSLHELAYKILLYKKRLPAN